LEDALETNIRQYLGASFLARYGFAVRVSVATRAGKFLYPSTLETPGTGQSQPDSPRVAVQNFALLNEGLVVQVEARLEHNRLISNAVLGLYVFAALAILLVHYRTAGRKLSREERERRNEIERLAELERKNTAKLSDLHLERERLRSEFERVKAAMESERARADRNEDDLIGEIESLEEKLNENLGLQSSQEEEIRGLKEKLELLEKEQRREDRGRSKAASAFQKRFAALYKNTAVSERAVEGLLELNEEMRLKAEEVIHQLNAAPDLVVVKRKVFGKKNRETVLEVVFAYKGRLYFRRREGRVDVVAIGTKNTQERELEFLASL
jgi:chromosome segregation ATPase